jgi:transglutaminase superfamily protein/coenzyme PQQ synthesis protein D (PqqD)
VSAVLLAARALARPRGAARLVPSRLRGAFLRAAVEVLLRRSRLDDLLDLLARAPGRSAPRPAVGPARTGARATVAGLRRLPATCLHRALAGYAGLREAGEDARFVIGVRREGDDVLAHAWIEQDGKPLGEPTDPRERFTVAWAHPPSGPGRQEEREMAARRPSPEIVLTRLADGTGVLLHLGTKFYYTLNRTGVVAWEAISSGAPADPDALADLLVERFAGVDRAQARADVESLLRELEAEGLLAKEP